MIFSKNRAANPQASPSKSQTDKKSIPEATDGITGRLRDYSVVPVHIATVVVQDTVPGCGGVVLGSTPEESANANIDEKTTATAITTWESRKVACISSGTW